MRRVVRNVLCLCLVVGFCAQPPAARAQDGDDDKITPKEYVAYIRRKISEADKVYKDGRGDEAIAMIDALDAEVDPYRKFLGDHIAYWWPDLMLSRITYHLKKFDRSVEVSSRLVSELDTDKHRTGVTRVEALYNLARALYRQKRHRDVEPVLRSWRALADVSEHEKDLWRTEIDYMLARTATRNRSPDARALRAEVLVDFLDRPGATPNLYRYLRHADLGARRDAGDPADAEELYLDAREFEGFLATMEADNAVWDSRALVARIYAERGENERAKELMERRLDYVIRTAPGGSRQMSAWQNLVTLLGRLQEDEAAVAEADEALGFAETVDKQTDAFVRALSATWRSRAQSLQRLGRREEAQENFREAYAVARRIYSVNHPTVLKLRDRINRALATEADWPFAKELTGLDAGKYSLSLTLDGSSMARDVFAGRYLDVATALDYYTGRDEADQGELELSKAYFHALMGEIGKSETALAKAQKMAADPQKTTRLEPDSSAYDLVEMLAHSFARDHDMRRALPAIERLKANKTLKVKYRALALVSEIHVHAAEGELTRARALFDEHLDLLLAEADTTPWGIAIGLLLIEQHVRFREHEAAEAYQAALMEKLLETEGIDLAVVLAQTFWFNTGTGTLNDNRRFQTLAFHLRSLSRMLPEEHLFAIAARVNYAFALSTRGEFEAFIELIDQSTTSYRKSPWARPDVIAFLDANRAWGQWLNGRPELAHPILEQVYSLVQPKAWRPDYVAEIVWMYAISQGAQSKATRGMRALDRLLEDPEVETRLLPQDKSRLWYQRGALAGQLGLTALQLQALDNAVAAIPSDAYLRGWPMSTALSQRAAGRYHHGDHVGAYADIHRSNRIYFAYFADASGSARNTVEDRNRVIDEARIGWELSKELKAGSGTNAD